MGYHWMSRSFRNEVLLGIFFVFVIALLIYMFQVVGGKTIADQIEITADFDSAAGLVPENFVMVAGVPVGSIKRIDVDFNRARVRMLINRAAHIRQDVQARIRAKSLLGEKYVELVPQSRDAQEMADGGHIQATSVPVEVDEVFTALRPFLEKLDPMAPKIEGVLTELETLLGQLNETGREKKETVARIIEQTDELLSQANQLVRNNEAKLTRTMDQMDRLTNTAVQRTPALLAKADETLQRIDRIAQAVPVETLQRVPATYDKLDDAIEQVADLTGRLNRSGDRIERILTNLDILFGRLLAVDELAIRKFLQQEGVNINLTQDEASKKRIRELEQSQSKP